MKSESIDKKESYSVKYIENIQQNSIEGSQDDSVIEA